ncbi:MAG: ABC transporter permease, partial [Planctomycetota bacterium]
MNRIVQTIMNILAVARADLMTLSRARGRGFERTLFLGILVTTVALSWPSGTSSSVRIMSTFGSRLFYAFFVAAYISACFLVPALFSSTFSREKRDQSGLLLLSTPLSAMEIVLGRFISHFGRVLLLLACAAPVLFSTLLFGGVAADQVMTSVAAILALAVFLGAVTLFVSLLSPKGHVAGGAVVTFLLLDLILVSFVVRLISFKYNMPAAEEIGLVLTPHLGLAITALGQTPARLGFWFFFGENLVLGALALIASMLLLRPVLLSSKAPAEKPKPVPARSVPRGPLPAGLQEADPAVTYRGPVWRNPVAWKDVKIRKKVKPWAKWTLGIGLALILILIFYNLPSGRVELKDVHVFLVPVEVLVLSLLATSKAAAAISKEREEGRLDLLAITPLSGSVVWWGKWVGVLRSLLPVCLFVCAHYLIWGLASLGPGGTPSLPGVTMHEGWHPLQDLLRFLPLLSTCMILSLTIVLSTSWGLLATLVSKRNSTSSFLSGGGLILWWIGLPLFALILDWEEA